MLIFDSNIKDLTKKWEKASRKLTANQAQTLLLQALFSVAVPAAKARLNKLIMGYTRKGSWPRTNALAGSITAVKKTGTVCRFGTPFVYGRFVEKGTGKYGPKKGWIHPKSQPAMVWYDTAGQKWAASKTAGMPPRPFLLPTLMDKQKEIAEWILKRASKLLK